MVVNTVHYAGCHTSIFMDRFYYCPVLPLCLLFRPPRPPDRGNYIFYASSGQRQFSTNLNDGLSITVWVRVSKVLGLG